ncbi:MAG: helix-turn-helix domain-containing protein [Acetatifactor sp.]|nr:helix-turn-helix domain-containing protein [Acetatifactor sp.]
MNVKDAVAKRFQQICKERNMTLNELANLSGVTPSTLYSMMDERRRDISIITIKKFCDGLEMPLDEFFHDKIFEELEPEIK